jgi:hypothetical protein
MNRDVWKSHLGIYGRRKQRMGAIVIIFIQTQPKRLMPIRQWYPEPRKQAITPYLCIRIQADWLAVSIVVLLRLRRHLNR